MASSRLTRITTISLFIVGGLFFAVNLGFQSAFAGRALPGAQFEGQNLAGRTYSQIKTIVASGHTQPNIDVTINHQSFVIAPSEVDLSADLNRFASEVTQPSASKGVPLLALLHPAPVVTLGYTADGSKLGQIISTKVAAIGRPATDARVSISGGQITIIPGEPGLGIEPDQATSEIAGALAIGASAVTLNSQPIEPAITPESLASIVADLQKRLELGIKLTYQGKTYTPDKATLGSWFVVTTGPDGPQIGTSSEQIKKYLDQIGKSVNVPVKNKLINTVNGAVQSTTEGVNGSQIDQATLTTAISGALLASQPLTTEIPTQVVAFKTTYNKTYNLDSPKYIEVNLSTQHLWVYQDHQVIMDTPITSGSTGTGHPTIQGLFAVYAKERDRWLDGRPLGYNYNVFVQYWMPFHADYGLHDASWRHSFGGPDYYYGGSHGCVNMPIPAAAWLYGWVDVGTPVWIHS